MSENKSISAEDALKLGQAAASKGNKEQAEKYFNAVLAKYPDHKEAIEQIHALNPGSLFQTDINELQKLFNEKQFREVEVRAKIKLDHFADVAVLNSLIGVALAMQGKFQESLSYLNKAVTLNTFDTNAHFNLGNSYKALQQSAKAITSFVAAIKLDKGHLGAYNNLGNLYRSLGQFDDALKCYGVMNDLSANNIQIYMNFASTYREMGDNEKAIDYYKKVISLKPNYAIAYNDMATCLNKLGDNDEAIEYYERAIELSPDYVDAYNNLGNILQATGEAEAAISSFEKAIMVSPNAATYNNLGNALREQGDFSGAIKNLENATRYNPSGLEIYFNLGNVQAENSDYDKAITCFEQARLILPNGPVCIINLAILNYIIGNEDQTAALLKELSNDLLASIKDPKKLQFCSAYKIYLKELIKFNKKNKRPKKTDASKIWVIGDNVSLSPIGHIINVDATEYVAAAKWMAGAKAFHLSQNKPNKYKASLKRHLAQIQSGSPVIYNFGTIDCRLDEGIIVAARKTGNSIKKIAKQTVAGYFDFSYDAAMEAQLNPYYCAIPAPFISKDDKGCAELLEAIAEFNKELKARCAAKKCLYIDLHKLTVTSDGLADGTKHLDLYHLIPTAINDAING